MDKTTLLSYMPKYYKASSIIDNINNTHALELNNYNNNLNSVLNQFFVATSDVALNRWEKELGIITNSNYNSDYRKTIIISKLRGTGTVTIGMIQNVANSFSNGQVTIIEHPSIYSFEVKFTSTYGIPPNLQDLQNAINQIKPAHLAVTYTYLYTQWSKAKTITWATVKTKTWSDLLNGRTI